MTQLSPFPGKGFSDFDQNIIQWATGDHTTTNGDNPLIKFYLDRKDWLQPNTNVINNLLGWIQNIWYGLLHALATGVDYLIQAALFPLYTLPKMLMEDTGSQLHVLYLASVALGAGLMGIYFIMSMIGYMTSAKTDVLKSKTKNIFGNLAMILLLPFIFYMAGSLMNSIVGNSNGSLNFADTPLQTNTLDLEQWAITDFAQAPFSDGAPTYNKLGQGNEVPDFTDSIGKSDIEPLDSYGTDKISHGKINHIGSVFNYQLETVPSKTGGVQYGLSKIDLDGGFLKGLGVSYKRYRVQNIPATGAFIIIIVVGFLMAIKIMRASIGMFGKIIVAPVAAGRDGANSVEGIKGTAQDIVNGYLGIFLDLFMLQIFASLIGPLPQSVANQFANAGGFIKGIIYLLTMGVLAWACYDGSSAIEKQFGMAGGAKGQGSFMGRMAAPGVALGALAGAGATKLNEQRKIRQERARQNDKPKDNPNKPVVDHGNQDQEKAEQLSNADTPEENRANGSQPMSSEDKKQSEGSENSNQKKNDKLGQDSSRKLNDSSETNSPSEKNQSNKNNPTEGTPAGKKATDEKGSSAKSNTNKQGQEAADKLSSFSDANETNERSEDVASGNQNKVSASSTPSTQQRLEQMERQQRQRQSEERVQRIRQKAAQRQAQLKQKRQRAMQQLAQDSKDPHQSAHQK
ncbi:hypothetical protein [Fructobacillus cardui]|uniref:hypothetical protein n=1 Tax=Fructobacillus cardui TaxID=2893170 RepID=UPI00200A3E19|nr:hypothetical protein [Fructobacillus cardui]MCK8627021.1 hypothetical protein [Fructobacillus cardui]